MVPYDEGDDVKIAHDYKVYFGGVVMFNRDDYLAVNGFSNEYEGWGFEDADLRRRCITVGLEIQYRDGTYHPLHHKNAGMERSLKYNDVALANEERLEIRWRDNAFPDFMKNDGIAQLRYTVDAREHPIEVGGKPVTHVELVKVSFP